MNEERTKLSTANLEHGARFAGEIMEAADGDGASAMTILITAAATMLCGFSDMGVREMMAMKLGQRSLEFAERLDRLAEARHG